jgi:hypothetical protein
MERQARVLLVNTMIFNKSVFIRPRACLMRPSHRAYRRNLLLTELKSVSLTLMGSPQASSSTGPSSSWSRRAASSCTSLSSPKMGASGVSASEVPVRESGCLI